MLSTRLIDAFGNEMDSVFTIKKILIKNYYAYLECEITSSEDQNIAQAFSFSYLFQGREYPIGNVKYWIDTIPDQIDLTEQNYQHVNIQKNKKISLRINLYGGVLMGLNLTKEIRLLINNVTASKEVIYVSDEIFLMSKDVAKPMIEHNIHVDHGNLTVATFYHWYHDYDFNYYSDDFKVYLDIKTFDQKDYYLEARFINNKQVDFLVENLPEGLYIISLKIYLFNGYIVYEDTVILSTKQVRPVAYIKTQGKVRKTKAIYYKTSKGIVKEVKSVGIFDDYIKKIV